MSKLNLKKYAKEVITEKKKIKYDMKNVNGGFSDGVEIRPGQHAGVMNISIDIYGGSTSTALAYPVPDRIKQLQTGFLAARRTGDPVDQALYGELEAYYENLRRAIALEVYQLMRQFDAQVGQVVSNAVNNYNQRET